MKKMLRRRMGIILIIGMACSLLIGYYLQLEMLRRDAEEASTWLFWQVQQILEENQIETNQATAEFREQCLLKANAAAYIIQNSDVDISDQDEMKRIAELLQIDELHLFDTDGIIFAGSESKYFGYCFNSGQQMRFFLPMLEDKTLSLCQDVTPNTAEGKMMQYAAVWKEDGTGIVQIGMEPARILHAMKKNELSYIFSLLTESDKAVLCAADPVTYDILGSTDPKFMGHSLTGLGFSKDVLSHLDTCFDEQSLRHSKSNRVEYSFHTEVNGKASYCMFTHMNGLLIGRFYDVESLYAPVRQNMLLMTALLVAITLLMLLCIFYYLDSIVIQSITDINDKLRDIANGDLTKNVDVSTTPEFSQLSWYINHMVKSILEMTTKLSSVLDAVQLPIAVYEYSRRTNRVYFSSKLAEILDLSDEDADRLLHNRRLFEEELGKFKANPTGGNVFRLPGKSTRYIKMEEYASESSFFGILMDVTADITEKRRIEEERDMDLLTGLCNRRAFHVQMDALFLQPEQLKHAAILMMDTDDLKRVNDRYGHEAGDQYLRGMAHILHTFSAPQQVAARLSGDEFAVLVYGCETEEDLQTYIAEMTGKQSSTTTRFSGQILPVKFSMGVSRYPEDGTDHRVLLKLADQRMYENKRERKSTTA